MTSTMKDLISKYLNDGLVSIPVTYKTSTTSTNGEIIEIFIGGTPVGKTDTTGIDKFTRELQASIPEGLNAVTRRLEFHFRYPDFNSCSTRTVIVEISRTNRTKPGITTLSLSMIGRREAMKVIYEHPDYELHLRRGFSYRGRQEGPATLEEVTAALREMACCDLNVVDDEIHINTFSSNDMQ